MARSLYQDTEDAELHKDLKVYLFIYLFNSIYIDFASKDSIIQFILTLHPRIA